MARNSPHVPLDSDEALSCDEKAVRWGYDEKAVRWATPSIERRGLAQHLDAVVELLDVLDTSLQKLAEVLAPALKAGPELAPQEQATREKVTPLSDRVDGMGRHARELVDYTRALTERVYL